MAVIMYKDKEAVMNILENFKKHGDTDILDVIKESSAKIRSDKEVMSEAMGINPGAVRYLTDKLKNDKDFIINCINNNKYPGDIFNNASEKLQEDKDVVIALAKTQVNKNLIPEQFHSDQDVIDAIGFNARVNIASKNMSLDDKLAQAASMRKENNNDSKDTKNKDLEI